jgi:mannan endo-1,4-beta-mannosidase
MRKTILAIAILPVLLSGCSVLQHASAVKPGHRHHVQPQPAPAYYIGIREPAFPASWKAVSDFGTLTGTAPSLVLWYMAWGSPFPQRFATVVDNHGATPLIQLNPTAVSMRSVAAGRYDSYLHSYAKQVRAYGHQVVIGFGHEMNGTWYTWGYHHQSPASFVAAWQHVVAVFRRAGAKNVIWLWTVSHTAPQRYGAYWPGNKYVTWVGIDGYMASPGASFKNVFGSAVTAVRRLTSKPVLLAEVGVSPRTHRQIADIRSLFAGVKQYHLLGLVYYDVDQDGAHVHQDWRLEGHESLLRAFRQADMLLN